MRTFGKFIRQRAIRVGLGKVTALGAKLRFAKQTIYDFFNARSPEDVASKHLTTLESFAVALGFSEYDELVEAWKRDDLGAGIPQVTDWDRLLELADVIANDEGMSQSAVLREAISLLGEEDGAGPDSLPGDDPSDDAGSGAKLPKFPRLPQSSGQAAGRKAARPKHNPPN